MSSERCVSRNEFRDESDVIMCDNRSPRKRSQTWSYGDDTDKGMNTEIKRARYKMKQRSISEGMDASQLGSSSEPTSSSVPTALHSKAIEVPSKNRYHSESQKYSKMMEFPFADGSPIRDLANFYQECLQARSHSDEWCDIPEPLSGSSDSEAMSRQLKQFEDAVPEFDSMVASMFSNSENGDS